MGTNITAVVTTLPRPGVKRSGIEVGPPRTIHILAMLFVTALSAAVHVIPKRDDRPPALAEGLLSTRM